MSRIVKGNILEADAEALVNTVNCVGHMGKGIALQFKKAFPENYLAYKKACDAGEVRPGGMFVFDTGTWINPRHIINFPTKRHWRGKSRLEDIETGLRSLIRELREREIKSVAVPPLGCGLGGLAWHVVKPMILAAFEEALDIDLLLFEPISAPEARAMPVRTTPPRMTTARALLIKLMHQYSEFAYRMTLLEIQKLAYFLQESGEPLRLRHEAGIYGPYAYNLNKVLEVMEGHFTCGYGDTQRPDVEIELREQAVGEADSFLSGRTESLARLDRVATLIQGFETPYGMELLSSVHWVVKHGDPPAMNPDDAILMVHGWNTRKRHMFQAEHIITAWESLFAAGWLA